MNLLNNIFGSFFVAICLLIANENNLQAIPAIRGSDVTEFHTSIRGANQDAFYWFLSENPSYANVHGSLKTPDYMHDSIQYMASCVRETINPEHLRGPSSLSVAILAKNLEAAEYLLSFGADPNAAYMEVTGSHPDYIIRTHTPLGQAKQMNDQALVDLLLSFGADPSNLGSSFGVHYKGYGDYRRL